MVGMKNRIIAFMMVVLLLFGNILSTAAISVKAAPGTGAINVTVKYPELDTIKLQWQAVSGANGYNIYMSTKKNGTYQLISSVVGTSLVIDSLDRDTTYYFKVVSYKKNSSAIVEGASSDSIETRSVNIGIDVSHHQNRANSAEKDITKKVDWQKVKASGIQYAIIRTSYSTVTADEYFDINMQEAIKAGMPVGVYIYSLADTVKEAEKEAEYVLEKIKGYKLQYPIMFDIEDAVHKKLSKKQNTNIIKAFCEKIEAAGYPVMIYSGCSFSRTYLDLNELKDYDLWIAHYTTSGQLINDEYHHGSSCNYPLVRMWQYSSSGRVDGIVGNVDMNYMFDHTESMLDTVTLNGKTAVSSYAASKDITVTELAKRLGITAELILANNENMTSNTVIKAGTQVTLNQNALYKSNITSATSNHAERVQLKWTTVLGADGYYIYQSSTKNPNYQLVATTPATSYTVTNLMPGDTYSYKVIPYRNKISGIERGPESTVVSCKVIVPKVANVVAKNVTYNANELTWNTSSGATGYYVYASTSKSGSYKKIATVSKNTYRHEKLDTGTTYYYKVYAYHKKADQTTKSSASSVVSAKPVLAKPTQFTAKTAGYNSVSLSWKKVTGAESYSIYRATSKTGTYRKVTTVKTNSYTDKGLTNNKTYYYKVVANRKVNGKTVSSAQSAIVSAKPTLAKVKNLKAEVASYNSIKLTWSKASEATSYYVYRATSKTGTYKKIATVSGTAYTDKKLTTGKKYYYKVVAIKKVGKNIFKSGDSSIIEKKPTVSKPKITLKAGTKTATVSWKKVSGATGYEVYRATSKKGEYKRVKTTTSTSYKNTKLTKNKTYYYKVRAYRVVSGKKVYSSYSSVQSVKIK